VSRSRAIDDLRPVPKLEDTEFKVIGGLVFILVFVGFFGWSYFAPLDAASPAPGKIVVEGELKVVQHLEGGILSELFVRPGERVERGQILARLDATQIKANLEVLSAQSAAVAAKMARLEAERDGRTRIDWQDAFGLQNQKQYAAILLEQQALFEKRRTSISGEVNILKRKIEQLVNKASALKQSLATQQQLLSSFEKEHSKLNELLIQGYVDESQVNNLARKMVEISGNIQQLRADSNTAEIQIGETELQIIQKQTVYDADVQNQYAELYAKRLQIDEQIRVALDKRIRSEIKAPASGRILSIDVTTVGGIVGSGKAFITIVPEREVLLVEAQVNPVDVERVKVGQIAEVQVAAFDMTKMPRVFGSVVSISPDAISATSGRGTYYKTMLSISDDEMAKFGGSNLIPGMPVNVLIKTGERTLWEYLMKPLMKGMDGALLER